MNTLLKTLISLSIIVLFSYLAKGQSGTTSTETILKLENPYKKNRTKWLNKNGFNTNTYTWDDPEINLYLDQAVKKRSAGNVLVYTGGGILAFGLFANFVGRMIHEISEDKEPGEEYQVFKGPYYLGGTLAASAIVLHLNADSKLKKARKAREKKFK